MEEDIYHKTPVAFIRLPYIHFTTDLTTGCISLYLHQQAMPIPSPQTKGVDRHCIGKTTHRQCLKGTQCYRLFSPVAFYNGCLDYQNCVLTVSEAHVSSVIPLSRRQAFDDRGASCQRETLITNNLQVRPRGDGLASGTRYPAIPGGSRPRTSSFWKERQIQHLQ